MDNGENKFTLTVVDRLALLNNLPPEGDITTIRIVRSLRDELSFTEEEHQRLKFHYEGQSVRWDDSADKSREYIFGDKALEIIRMFVTDWLKRLNKDKKLNEQYISIAEKFVDVDNIDFTIYEDSKDGKNIVNSDK